jgi:hypothetical protein
LFSDDEYLESYFSIQRILDDGTEYQQTIFSKHCDLWHEIAKFCEDATKEMLMKNKKIKI